MSIMQAGVDVTEGVMARVKTLAVEEKLKTNHFYDTVGWLIRAKDSLNDLPVPWMNDCIYDSIVAIDKIIKELEE